MPEVPPLLQYLLGAWLPSILAWLETRLMRSVLLRCNDHPLLQLAQLYDPAPVVAACADYHHPPGTKGATPTYTNVATVRCGRRIVARKAARRRSSSPVEDRSPFYW